MRNPIAALLLLIGAVWIAVPLTLAAFNAESWNSWPVFRAACGLLVGIVFITAGAMLAAG